MPEEWRLLVKKEYNGFQIVKKRHCAGGGYCHYFSIYKDGEPYSILTLNSEKACINVINTHVQAQKEKQYLENFIQDYKGKK